jgi:urate oxidase
MSAIKFLSWILGVVFTLGLADSFAHLTYKMGQAAIHAHQHDQISYSSYNKLLWQKNPTQQAAIKTRH